LRDWVHRYNERGVEGLKNLPERRSPPRKLTAAQEAAVAAWVRQGPTLEEHKVIRWRLIDLRDEIARQFGMHLHERTVGKLMARMNFSRVSVRPRHGPNRMLRRRRYTKKIRRIGRRRHSPVRPRQADRTLVADAMSAGTARPEPSDWRAFATRSEVCRHAVE
jgi:transposase